MLIGLHLLFKIAKEKDYDALLRIDPAWLDPTEQEEYRKLREYIDSFGSFPPEEALPQTLEGFENYPVEYYIEKVKERYILNELKSLSSFVDPKDTQRSLEVVTSKVNKLVLSTLTSSGKVITGDEYERFTKETIEELRERALGPMVGIPTGFPSIDAATGGYYDADIFVFVGRMKTGKTIYMIQSLAHILFDKKAMFITMEMTPAEINIRLQSILNKLPMSYFLHGRVSSFAEREILERTKKIKDNLILIEGGQLRDTSDIVSLVEGYKPDIIYIDGAYLLPCRQRYNSEWEKAKNIIENLKRLALRTKLPFVCSYQLNRQATKAKDVDLEHIALSDAIGQIASAVVAIKPDVLPDQRVMKLLANRRGPADIEFVVKWDWLTPAFREVDEHADTQGTETLSDDILE